MTNVKTRRSLLLTATLVLSAVALPASATNWWVAAPHLSIGSRSVNVHNYGARGDGVHNDTAAIQAAINALPSTGGTVFVPAGKYMIDALRSVNLRSHTRLKLDPMAQLVAIPNASTRYVVVKVIGINNAEIVGGKIVGERDRHRGTDGQWGYAVNISGSSKVYVHNVQLLNCWGDGMWIGATGAHAGAVVSTDVTINNIYASNNRRQGLSIGPVNRVYILNSTFTKSNGFIANNGIDIEPQTQGTTRNVLIENNFLTNNRSNGLEMHANVTGIVVKGNTMKGNHGYGFLDQDAANITMTGNLVTENGLDGVAMSNKSNNVQISGNTLTYNSTRWFIANHRSIYTKTKSARDIQIDPSTWAIHLATNAISPKP